MFTIREYLVGYLRRAVMYVMQLQENDAWHRA